MARPINPDDEIFWYAVRDAYDQVVVQTGTEVTVEVNDRRAMVFHGIGSDDGCVFVKIEDINPRQRDLNVV